jgi:hypothetical protein
MSAVVSRASAASPLIATGAGPDRNGPDRDRFDRDGFDRDGLDRDAPARSLRAILLAGAAAATLDLTFAFTFYGATVGVSPVRVLQSIASGAFGMASFAGGIAAAAFGLVAHYLILIVAAAFYYAASVHLPALRRHAAACGMLFGVAIYCVMNYVVVPLSAAPRFKSTPLSVTSEFLMHMVLGLTIALIVRRVATRRA